jgi:hypothetical protein
MKKHFCLENETRKCKVEKFYQQGASVYSNQPGSVLGDSKMALVLLGHVSDFEVSVEF